jgi:hypothetical protein
MTDEKKLAEFMYCVGVLLDHCRETHPHFEGPRGQGDMLAVIERAKALGYDVSETMLPDSI